jgi:hypothetical protein
VHPARESSTPATTKIAKYFLKQNPVFPIVLPPCVVIQ